MKKRTLSGLLAAALALSLCVLPAAASFPDVTDPAVADAVEVLRQLDVINGKPDGTYDPQGTFTRAEFCKMAIVILGRSREAQLQSSRVIFSDVTAAHWALGYINAAASSANGTPLVNGTGDGRFQPEAPITYGEAVAILMRALGYSDQDVRTPGKWYEGYMKYAGQNGLLEGLPANGETALTRGEAALLFENLLFTTPKNGGAIFLSAVLGGSVTEAQLVLEVNGKALSSGGYALVTSQGTYRTLRTGWDPELQGKQAKLVLDASRNVLAVLPDTGFTSHTLRITDAQSRYVTVQGGEQVLVPASTPVWQPGSRDPGTYGALYTTPAFAYGVSAVFCYDNTDTLTSIFILSDSESAVTAVCTDAARPFSDILPVGSVTVYKGGVLSDLSAVKLYDVGVYDGSAGVLTVYSHKLTGTYENAAPSIASPSRVTVQGQTLQVLDSALKDLRDFKLGDRITLLLDGSNSVAGAVSPDVCTAEMLGVAALTPISGSRCGASVALTGGLTVTGEVTANPDAVQLSPGRLVSVTADGTRLTLTAPEAVTAPGAWNVAAGTLGSLAVSPTAALYDKTENGPLVKLDRSQVTVTSVPASKIAYYHTDTANVVDILILRDVTGDAYTYGILDRMGTVTEYSGSLSATNTAAYLVNADSRSGVPFITAQPLSDKVGQPFGMAPTLLTLGGTPKLDASVPLQSLTNVRRTAFDGGAVTVDRVTYPLAANIDACCYNAGAKEWFASLDEALAYTSQFTLYYDKSPAEGGKIRLVVAP